MLGISAPADATTIFIHRSESLDIDRAETTISEISAEDVRKIVLFLRYHLFTRNCWLPTLDYQML